MPDMRIGYALLFITICPTIYFDSNSDSDEDEDGLDDRSGDAAKVRSTPLHRSKLRRVKETNEEKFLCTHGETQAHFCSQMEKIKSRSHGIQQKRRTRLADKVKPFHNNNMASNITL